TRCGRGADLEVMPDETRIATGGVEVLSQILEEHPNEERPEREPLDGEQEQRLGSGGGGLGGVHEVLPSADDQPALVNTLVHALPAFGKSRALPGGTGKPGTPLPFTEG